MWAEAKGHTALNKPSPALVDRGTAFDGPPVRHRLDVVAGSVLEAVQDIGGLIFDCAFAGWRVNVVSPSSDGETPLRILGASAHDFEAWIEEPCRPDRLTIVAVSAAVARSEPVVSQQVSEWLALDLRKLIVWGDSAPGIFHARFNDVERRMTLAARVFKRQALLAASTDIPVATTESFRTSSSSPELYQSLRMQFG